MADTKDNTLQGKDFEVEEYTNDQGEKFCIGRPKGSAEVKAKIDASDDDKVGSHGASFNVNVNWSPPNSGYTDSGFASQTGITHWNVINGGSVFTYRITFDCNQTYDYFFQDATNEKSGKYECNVWKSGTHYVDYNSSKPDIISVSGS